MGNQSCPLRLSRGIGIAFVVRATGGRGGERVLRGVSWGSLSAWLGARGKIRLGTRGSKLSPTPGSTVGTVELTSTPHSAQEFSRKIPEGSQPEFSPRAKPS